MFEILTSGTRNRWEGAGSLEVCGHSQRKGHDEWRRKSCQLLVCQWNEWFILISIATKQYWCEKGLDLCWSKWWFAHMADTRMPWKMMAFQMCVLSMPMPTYGIHIETPCGEIGWRRNIAVRSRREENTSNKNGKWKEKTGRQQLHRLSTTATRLMCSRRCIVTLCSTVGLCSVHELWLRAPYSTIRFDCLQMMYYCMCRSWTKKSTAKKRARV